MWMRAERESCVKVCSVTITMGVEGYEDTSSCSSSLLREAKAASWCMYWSMGISFSFSSTGVARPEQNTHTHVHTELG